MRISDWSSDVCSSDPSTNAQKGLVAPIAAVTTPDAATVVITLKQPTGNFLFNLGWGDAVIVAPESAAENKNHPVGTGPFVFERWVKGDRIELLRNPDYWGKPARLAKIGRAHVLTPVHNAHTV